MAGKFFAFTGEASLGVKCGRTADDAAEICDCYPHTATVMPYIGRYGWNTVRIDGEAPEGGG